MGDGGAPEQPAASDLTARLASAPAAARRDLLVGFVSREVATVLGLDPMQPVATGVGLFDLGMDSLMSVELSNRLRESLDCQLPTTLAFEHPTVAALADHLAKQVLRLDETASAPVAADESELARERLLEDVERLQDDEVERSLAEELDRAGY